MAVIPFSTLCEVRSVQYRGGPEPLTGVPPQVVHPYLEVDKQLQDANY
jgi:hypothetical protein